MAMDVQKEEGQGLVCNDTMDRLDKLKEFLRQTRLPGWQVFDCESLTDDPRETVYDKDGIQVKVSEYYEYVEILGLSEKEYRSLINRHGRFKLQHLKKDL